MLLWGLFSLYHWNSFLNSYSLSLLVTMQDQVTKVPKFNVKFCRSWSLMLDFAPELHWKNFVFYNSFMILITLRNVCSCKPSYLQISNIKYCILFYLQNQWVSELCAFTVCIVFIIFSPRQNRCLLYLVFTITIMD
jgi:hypothetical protein